MEPMTDLFQSSVVVLEPDRSGGGYRFTDDQGRPLGQGVQVVGPPRAGGLAGAVASVATSGIGSERTVLRVDRPDGGPLLFVDRAEMLPGVMVAPAAVVAPDGTLIGRVHHRLVPPNVNTYGVFNAQGGLLCEAVMDPLVSHGHTDHGYIRGGRQLTYTDSHGMEIARREPVDRYRDVLKLNHRLPEPLHTLVVASALAVNMMGLTGAPVGRR